MRIVLQEFVTGGGWHAHSAEPPPRSLKAEGQAMLAALAADFAALPGTQVDVLHDTRFDLGLLPGCTWHAVANADEHERCFATLASQADWTLVIAPEFSGVLLAQCRTVERLGGRLLGPSSRLVELASDKQATAQHLLAHGVPAPRGIALEAGTALPAEFPCPAVLKPRDGAGSWGVELLSHGIDRRAVWPARLEKFCPGTPASVGVLCGPGQIVPLRACGQRLGGASGFDYLGGTLPLPASLARRAQSLAVRAIGSLATPLGYLGVDLVLGTDPSGADDFVIEVNPRLTTSFVGLRSLCTTNLAAAMLALAEGGEVQLSWRGGSIQFDASGAVRWTEGTNDS